MNKTEVDDREYSKLKSLINKNLGFHCDQYKESHFKRRIAVRMRATNSHNYSDYIGVLKNDPEEYKNLMNTLTVNVTNFFRNPDSFQIVENEVLPDIIRSKSDSYNKSIRLWSAGCSIGVEAYSIAIILHKLLKNEFKKYRINIIGTDIDNEAITRANEGKYTETELKGVDNKIIDRYFEKKDGWYFLTEELKKIANFKWHDLISSPKMSGFDLVLCRNVTIYFEKELQEKLYTDFYNALNPGGYFVMGKTETLVGESQYLFKPYNSTERIYYR
ncbi:MAG: CheR family methyltransferase [Methanohalobium sp.]|uniref:CheR family methyltransferase n=1 Tax=Methanohalobium sp. TaxID=2837493 RepID=UPI00397CC426